MSFLIMWQFTVQYLTISQLWGVGGMDAKQVWCLVREILDDPLCEFYLMNESMDLCMDKTAVLKQKAYLFCPRQWPHVLQQVYLRKHIPLLLCVRGEGMVFSDDAGPLKVVGSTQRSS